MAKSRKRSVFTFKNRRTLPPWIPFVAAMILRLLKSTYRLHIVDPEDFLSKCDPWPGVFLLWHNRLLSLPLFFPKHLRERGVVLISSSRDGEYASSFIRHFHYQVVRGSSSRGGLKALRELRKATEQGLSPVITLDGPRGPRYEVQPGAAMVSRMCDIPLFPLSLNAPCRWELKSWDKAQIPKPFSRVELRIGRSFTLPRDLLSKDREEACRVIREAQLAVTDDSTGRGTN